MIDNSHIPQENYGTHIPALEWAIKNSTGNILECGCGTYSTPLINKYTGPNRKALSVDTNQSWIDKFKKYESDHHKFMRCPDGEGGYPAWNLLPYNAGWGVVFVDQDPGAGRPVSIIAAKDTAEFVVVHDANQPLFYSQPLRALFKYSYEYRGGHPSTLIMSNFKEINFA